jgi:acyl dehydratase
MLVREVLGRRSEPRGHRIESEQIRRFALTLGAADPIHLDLDRAVHDGVVAPFSFPLTLRSHVDLEELFPRLEHTVIPSSRRLEVFRTIRSGDTIEVVGWVAGLDESGEPVLRATVLEEGRDQEQRLVFRHEVTVIARPRAGKGRAG